ncbi:hypothetical protein MHB43_08050 [Paenibacillus sp. FSL H8-0317]|uniref:hypothetical protein n=1 Tax=Paenibacillus sp. FSL H8-0317 TaxID=2921385 RepID=UPI00325593BB
MNINLFKNLYIEATDSLMESQVRNIISNSINYFTDQLKIEADEIKVLILLSNDYSNDVGKYHFHLKASKILNENGSIIPPLIFKKKNIK